MPDLFVAQDTTGFTSYYVNAVNSGLLQKFAFQLVEKYRPVLKGVKTLDQLKRVIPRDDTLLNNFVSFAAVNGVPARWYYINQSRQLLLGQIKALVALDALGYSDYIKSINDGDNTFRRAVDAMQKGLSSEITSK